MTVLTVNNGNETTIERYKNLQSKLRCQKNAVKHAIRAARNAQIVADGKRKEVMAAIPFPVEQRLKDDIERFIEEGGEGYTHIMAELETYFEVELKTRCYMEV